MGVINALAKVPREFADALRMSKLQALIWLTCWWCWTLASMQFYLLPFTLSNMATTLKVPQTKISEANTTSMLSRSIGAAIFGIMSDQYGRKIPILIDLVLLAVFTLSSGFVKTYGQLIGCRFLFGIAYGGLYGLNMATVLEAVPRKARGVVAGFTQQGFAAGYLLASGFHLAMNPYGWRSLFWLGAGLTVTAFILRLVTPSYSVTADAVREAEGSVEVDEKAAVGGNLPFITKFRFAFRHHWPVFVYCLILTACFNTLGHGHMDLYPTFLVSERRLSIKQETWVTVILQSGGITGGIVGGYLSKYSPKWIAVCFAILMAPWLPLWVLPKTWNLLALGSFFLEFCYGCAIGNLGNILQQICPHPGIRAAFGGVAYNLGNAISSIAPTVETKLGEDFPLPDGRPDYSRTQMILAGIVLGILVLTLALMPLKKLNQEWDMEDPNLTIPTHEKGNQGYPFEHQGSHPVSPFKPSIEKENESKTGQEIQQVERVETQSGKDDEMV